MAVLNIRTAKRQGARLVISLGGVSGSGKTKSALLLAYGLAGFDSKKVGFLDTENRRGSLYADALKNEAGEVQEFFIGDLEPPFSPSRYSQAIKEFQEAGVEVLVIDSVSHEYEGTGGLLELREPLPGTTQMRDAYAKAEHKKFMNVLLQSHMHIIVCVRAREKVKIEKDEKNKTVYVPMGVMPIQEKNFMFEMTASLMMWNAGKEQQVIKCPDELAHILGREKGYITPDDGKLLREWIDGGEPLDAAVERAQADLKLVCEQGLDELQKAWKKLPAALRKKISADGKCPDVYKESATEYDRLRKETGKNSTAGLDELNAQVAAAAGQAETAAAGAA